MRPETARAGSARPDSRPDGGRSRPARRGSSHHRGSSQHRGVGRLGSKPRAASAAQPRQSELDRALAAAQAAPAPAAATFRALGLPALLAAALAEQGIEEPFAIQARALPDALAGRDVLGRAQTGSGKTLAFGLPMLARLAADGPAAPRAPRGLVLVPTRELAKQVGCVLEPLGQPLGVTVTTVYGGASMNVQISRLNRGVDIVVATPGRLIDLLDRGACTLSRIGVTVLDEADHMADLGFLPAVTRILGETPAGGQRLLFSATLDRDVERLVDAYLDEPALHAVAPVTDIAAAADHQVFVLPAGSKFAIAAELAGRPDRTMFFVRTKHGADRLARQLTKAGLPAAAIHGNLNQNQRHRALAAFTEGNPRVLVATDVAARGLHIDDVGLVVHFDPPRDHKDYLHRSGRTARAGATGTVVALVDPAQADDIARLHDAAGITPSRHEVEAGHPAVREVATAGAPIPPPPAARRDRPARRGERPARQDHPPRPGRSAAREDRPAQPARTARGAGSRAGAPGWDRGREQAHGPGRGKGHESRTGGSRYPGRDDAQPAGARGGPKDTRDSRGNGRPSSGTGRPAAGAGQPSRRRRSRSGSRQAS